MELQILKALDSKSAGKIKYYMRVGPTGGSRIADIRTYDAPHS